MTGSVVRAQSSLSSSSFASLGYSVSGVRDPLAARRRRRSAVPALATSPRARASGSSSGSTRCARSWRSWATPSARTPRCWSPAPTARARSSPTCDAVLRASGLRAGRYTSPHLVRVNERIAVDGRAIARARSTRAVARRARRGRARSCARGVLAAHPTFFEVLTAAAFAHFRRQRVDVAVLEVGLGGRLDATNVAEPLASAIVSVARDHEAYLGRRSRRSRARRRACCGAGAHDGRWGRCRARPAPPSRREARARGARLVEATRDSRVEADRPAAPARARPSRSGRRAPATPGLRPLPGAHQRANLVVALRLLEEAQARAGSRSTSSRAATAVAAHALAGTAAVGPGRAPAAPRRGAQPGRRARARRAPRGRARRSCSCSERCRTRTCAAWRRRSFRSRRASC